MPCVDAKPSDSVPLTLLLQLYVCSSFRIKAPLVDEVFSQSFFFIFLQCFFGV